MGWIDEERIMCEMAVSAYRAGAQIFILPIMQKNLQILWMKGELDNGYIRRII